MRSFVDVAAAHDLDCEFHRYHNRKIVGMFDPHFLIGPFPDTEEGEDLMMKVLLDLDLETGGARHAYTTWDYYRDGGDFVLRVHVDTLAMRRAARKFGSDLLRSA